MAEKSKKKYEKNEREKYRSDKNKETEYYGGHSPVVCQYCGFVIGAVEETQQVRCPSCDKVIYHLGQKC